MGVVLQPLLLRRGCGGGQDASIEASSAVTNAIEPCVLLLRCSPFTSLRALRLEPRLAWIPYRPAPMSFTSESGRHP